MHPLLHNRKYDKLLPIPEGFISTLLMTTRHPTTGTKMATLPPPSKVSPLRAYDLDSYRYY